jgi:tRNA pseudouridine38-40 synthase
MRCLRLTIAYDGTHYVGWQRQINGLSVQEVLEGAFAPLIKDPTGRGPTVAGAGRTDAGVHALGQVASVNLEIDLAAAAVHRALNVRLPPDVRVIGVVDAPLGFHARFHAIGKTYRYRIATLPVLSPFDRWFVWHTTEPRDVPAMQAAAAAFVGTHDFASFQGRDSAVRNTVRTLARVDVRATAGEIVIDVDGDGFLRHMVRAIVGTLAQVGAGTRDPASIPAMLASRDRQAGGPTAPAAGLTLVAVRYPPVC